MATRRIGELLVAEGLLTQGAVERALGFQRLSGERIKLGSILLNWDLLGEDALLAALARIHRCPAVPWRVLSAATIETVRLLPAARAIRLGAVPYQAESALIRVAFVNPGDLAAIDEVALVAGRRVVAGVATEIRMMQAQQRFYGRHVPLEFRAILQKVDRRSAAFQGAVGSTDSSAAQVAPTGPPPPAAAASGRAIAISGAPVRPAPPRAPAIDPVPIPQLPGPDPTPGAGGTREAFTGEDSLARWLEDALSAFRDPAWNPGGPSTRVTPPAGPRPSEAPRAADREPARATRTPADPVADMWQPASADGADMVASRMWTGAPPAENASARPREEALDEIIQTLLANLPRVVFLGIENDSIRGWRGKGPDVTAERVGFVRIPVRDATVFSRVLASGRPHSGFLEKSLWPRPLADLLGSDPPDCAVFPVRAGEGATAFLYADRLDQRLQQEDLLRLARAAVAATSVLSGPAPSIPTRPS